MLGQISNGVWYFWEVQEVRNSGLEDILKVRKVLNSGSFGLWVVDFAKDVFLFRML